MADDALTEEVYAAFVKELEDDDTEDETVVSRGCCGGRGCAEKGDCNACTGCRKK